MGDITDIKAAQTVKITGAEVDGTEQTAVRSFPWGEIRNADIITKAIDGTLNFTAGTPTEIKVGASRMDDRKVVFFIPDAKGKYGYTVGVQNIPVFKNQPITLYLSEDQGVWFDFDSGTHDLFVTEGSGEN
jgi:hypothetical protein